MYTPCSPSNTGAAGGSVGVRSAKTNKHTNKQKSKNDESNKEGENKLKYKHELQRWDGLTEMVNKSGTNERKKHVPVNPGK